MAEPARSRPDGHPRDGTGDQWRELNPPPALPRIPARYFLAGCEGDCRANGRTAHDLVIRAVDARVLPVTQLPAALQEWRAPKFAEFAAGGKTAWRLFNAFTEAWKGRSLATLPRRSQAHHGLVDAACGLAA